MGQQQQQQRHQQQQQQEQQHEQYYGGNNGTPRNQHKPQNPERKTQNVKSKTRTHSKPTPPAPCHRGTQRHQQHHTPVPLGLHVTRCASPTSNVNNNNNNKHKQ